MTKNHVGQYFNIDGIIFNLKYLFKLHTIKPDIQANSINDLNLSELKTFNNIKYIVFDKDNTLTLPHKNKLANEEIQEKILEFKKIFGNEKIAILSNSAGSRDDREYKESEEIEFNTGLQVIKHQFKKPKVYKEILQTFKISENENFKKKEICVIGDRLLVDVIMGVEHGFFTILVKPITLKKDNLMVKLLRKFEYFLLRSELNNVNNKI